MLRTQHTEWQDAIRLAVGGDKNGTLLAVNVDVWVMLALIKRSWEHLSWGLYFLMAAIAGKAMQ